MTDYFQWFTVLGPMVAQWIVELKWLDVAAWVANFVACIAVSWAYLCRTAQVSKETTKWRYIALYAASGSVAFCAAFISTLDQIYPWLHIAMIWCYAADKAMGAIRWRHGPPAEVLHVHKGNP